MMRHFLFLLVLAINAPAIALGAMERGAVAYEGKDYATAFKQWAPLARTHDPRAQHNIGILYFNGEGVTQNQQTARRWFERAAQQGYARSQYNLGWIYEMGLGVEKNLTTARQWYGVAVAQEFAPAEFRLGLLYFTSGDYPRARSLLARAAAAGQAQAQFLLGKIYDEGLVGEKNKDLALRWYRIAANNGNGDGAYMLALHYLTLEKRNEFQIVNLLNQAAERGNVEAVNALGWAFVKGIGVKVDWVTATKLFLIAAREGYAEAGVNLAAIYSARRDYEKTYLWLVIAERLGSENIGNKKKLFAKRLDEEERQTAEAEAQRWLDKYRTKAL